MKKPEIENLEIQSGGPWNKEHNEDSEEIFSEAFEFILASLAENPNLYYIRIDDKTRFAEVVKRADDSVIYHTDNLKEIGLLEESGIEK